MSLFNLYSIIYHSEGFPLEDLRSIKMLTKDKFMELGDEALLKKIAVEHAVILIDEVQNYPESTLSLKILYDEFKVKIIACKKRIF